ncbi:MAG: CehA/McbA family metallohydrolase [Planctomycetales bacterium]|nr:CehA/McbA family metallohydrolase [Planctomycetales bacterium]
MSFPRTLVICCCLAMFVDASLVLGHEQTVSRYQATQRAAMAKAALLAEGQAQADPSRPTCKLTIELHDAKTKNPLAGTVRLTNLDSGKAVQLTGMIHRALNWYSIPAQAIIEVPCSKLQLEAIHGIESETQILELDTTATEQTVVKVPLYRFCDQRSQGLVGGNTHLHLMDMTYSEALDYLKKVPEADGLDLVFLSHLRRLPDESRYISNSIVENSFQPGGDLERLSRQGVLYANGEEHRHNFSRGGEGYGHVMFLDMPKLIRPVSIGPGIMEGQGSDGIPLQHGIKEARDDGDTVIWCHNARGFEDVPNVMAGLIDALNINDGSTAKSYHDSFYKYLNLGRKVPFSTGTDWTIYDFSRVYVPVEGELTSKQWLTSLAAGKSFITNGAILKFSVDNHFSGDTIALSEPGELRVLASAAGRNDFHALELIYNGEIAHTAPSRPNEKHFTAEMDFRLKVNEPGWVALRVPEEAGKNEFDQDQFAHTSPIYLEMAGHRIFRADVANSLVEEIKENMDTINAQGTFESDEQWSAVMQVHRQAIATLQEWISQSSSSAP